MMLDAAHFLAHFSLLIPERQIPVGLSRVFPHVAGRIDAIISYRDPAMLLAGDSRISRLFEGFRAAEQAYRRTRIFPAMQLVGIRESLLRKYPELAMNVCRAFEESISA